jgi:hypothetical protein
MTAAAVERLTEMLVEDMRAHSDLPLLQRVHIADRVVDLLLTNLTVDDVPADLVAAIESRALNHSGGGGAAQ